MNEKLNNELNLYKFLFLFMLFLFLTSSQLDKLRSINTEFNETSNQLVIYNTELKEQNAQLLLENTELAQNNSLLEKKLLLMYFEVQEARDSQRVVVLPKRINIELGAYNLKFDSKCWLGEQYVGCTSYGRDITLVDNRTVAEIIETCNHEWLHNQIRVLDSQFEEQVVRQLDDKVIVPECEALREELR